MDAVEALTRAGGVMQWRDLRAVVHSRHIRAAVAQSLVLRVGGGTVFDSSWRAGLTPREVQLATRRLPVQQRRRVLSVARAADPRAANPFESVLRSIATTVPGWTPVPQVGIPTRGRAGRAHFTVDLADEDLHIVLEADSFEFHGKRKALDRDCRRYDRLVVNGWLVLRFSWEMVMTEPLLVGQLIADAVELRRPHAASAGLPGTDLTGSSPTAGSRPDGMESRRPPGLGSET